MKIYALLLVCFLLDFTLIKSTVEYTLDEATQKDVILIEARGNSASTHYGQPVSISMTNQTGKKVVIRIINGYRFTSADLDVQDVITTQDQLITLNPHENRIENVSGMCIQHANRAPSGEDKYTFSGLEKGPILAFSEVIDSLDEQTVSGQQAMWVLSDNESMFDLINYGGDDEWDMARHVARLTGRDLPSREAFEKEVAKRTQVRAELRGVFKFEFSRTVPIHIALFDENGIVLKEIYRKKAPAGKHAVEYSFDTMPYTGQTIYAKLIAFDDVLLERTITL